MKAPFFRTPYNYDTNEASNETALECKDESRTLQSHAEDADINVIVKRFGLTGEMPQGLKAPMFGDFSEVTDYRTAIHAIQEADRSFMAMPAEHRERWQNSPQKFMEWIDNAGNRAEAEKMGLVIPRPAPEAAKPPETTPTP